MLLSFNKMDCQDWTVITLNEKKKATKNVTGTNDEVVKTTHVNRQNKSNINAKKIEEKFDNDEYTVPKVTHNLQIQIQQARQEKNMTQKELAQKANISESIVKSYESGKAVPTQNDLNKMSKALGITLKNK